MTTDIPESESTLRETLVGVLTEYPVSVAFLFGSHARGETHDSSDVDIGVVFDSSQAGESGYNETLLGLSADLAVVLETDDVDVVDLRRAAPSLVRSVFEHGERLVGSEQTADKHRAELCHEEGGPSPAERFDDALAAIDDHLA
jgi:predicted nucleotidyltransferase